MIPSRLTVAIVLFGVCAPLVAADEKQEPVMKYTLEVDGKPHEIKPGVPLQIDGALNKPTLLLKAAETRTFTYGGVEFQYPSNFTWEADLEEPNCKSWTMSGNDFKIMYFAFSEEELPSQAFLTSMAGNFKNQADDPAKSIRPVKRNLGGKEYEGHQLVISVGGANIHTEAYAIKSPKGGRMMVFQDGLPDEKNISAEGIRTLELLEKTFKDTAPAETK